MLIKSPTLLGESTKQPSHLNNHNHAVNNSGLTGCEGGEAGEKSWTVANVVVSERERERDRETERCYIYIY